MNRDDLLKRCVDRRVAHETSVVAVSHLFYVYLLSALKKGQRVEVPNFGTFGTHIVGVKRQRRMPFFEMESDLADKVNERYRNLKPLIIGRYELIPVEDETEYEGKEPPYDPIVERYGKENLIDTSRDITADEFRHEEQGASLKHPTPKPRTVPPIQPDAEEATPRRGELIVPEHATPSQEKKLMPMLNLREEGMETPPPTGTGSETEPVTPPELSPRLREIPPAGGLSWLLQILFFLILIGLITYGLNYFGFVHFWGPEVEPSSSTEEPLPPIVTEKQEQAAQPPETQQAKPKPFEPSSAALGFTVQVASLNSRREANKTLIRLNKSGFDASISEAFVKGRKWFRVRVGRYATLDEAKVTAAKLTDAEGVGIWVAKIPPGE